MQIRINVNIKLNKLLRYFVLSDFVLLSGWGLIQPIFSLFVVESVQGATVVTVGIAAGIYWILKALMQLPLAAMLDKTDGEKDDFYVLIVGIMAIGCTAILFPLVREIWQLYLLQVLHAVGFAFYFVSWPAIFSRHLDKDKISFEWALDSTAASLGTGISAFLGGVIASHFGFISVFLLAGVLCMIAALILIMVPEILFPKITAPTVPAKVSKMGKI